MHVTLMSRANKRRWSVTILQILVKTAKAINRFTDQLPILLQKMLNLNIGIFKCQLHGKHILGDKKFVVQFFSSTIANKDFPLE